MTLSCYCVKKVLNCDFFQSSQTMRSVGTHDKKKAQTSKDKHYQVLNDNENILNNIIKYKVESEA